jgi:hypothetical protein
MAIVIGANTSASFEGACVISANWGYNPNIQRLYCLGNWQPNLTIDKPTETLSIVVYSPGPSYNTAASESCANANRQSASVSPAACGGTVDSIAGEWFVTSYGYSKDDPNMPGQETWGMQRWIAGTLGGSNSIPEPSFVLRGIAEGQADLSAAASSPGIIFTGDTIESSSGSVSAGGIGRANTITHGVVQTVGNGGTEAGKSGQGSASIQYTPLWLGT